MTVNHVLFTTIYDRRFSADDRRYYRKDSTGTCLCYETARLTIKNYLLVGSTISEKDARHWLSYEKVSLEKASLPNNVYCAP